MTNPGHAYHPPKLVLFLLSLSGDESILIAEDDPILIFNLL
jgi:hypothetical protein